MGRESKAYSHSVKEVEYFCPPLLVLLRYVCAGYIHHFPVAKSILWWCEQFLPGTVELKVKYISFGDTVCLMN